MLHRCFLNKAWIITVPCNEFCQFNMFPFLFFNARGLIMPAIIEESDIKKINCNQEQADFLDSFFVVGEGASRSWVPYFTAFLLDRRCSKDILRGLFDLSFTEFIFAFLALQSDHSQVDSHNATILLIEPKILRLLDLDALKATCHAEIVMGPEASMDSMVISQSLSSFVSSESNEAATELFKLMERYVYAIIRSEYKDSKFSINLTSSIGHSDSDIEKIGAILLSLVSKIEVTRFLRFRFNVNLFQVCFRNTQCMRIFVDLSISSLLEEKTRLVFQRLLLEFMFFKPVAETLKESQIIAKSSLINKLIPSQNFNCNIWQWAFPNIGNFLHFYMASYIGQALKRGNEKSAIAASRNIDTMRPLYAAMLVFNMVTLRDKDNDTALIQNIAGFSGEPYQKMFAVLKDEIESLKDLAKSNNYDHLTAEQKLMLQLMLRVFRIMHNYMSLTKLPEGYSYQDITARDVMRVYVGRWLAFDPNLDIFKSLNGTLKAFGIKCDLHSFLVKYVLELAEKGQEYDKFLQFFSQNINMFQSSSDQNTGETLDVTLQNLIGFFLDNFDAWRWGHELNADQTFNVTLQFEEDIINKISHSLDLKDDNSALSYIDRMPDISLSTGKKIWQLMSTYYDKEHWESFSFNEKVKKARKDSGSRVVLCDSNSERIRSFAKHSKDKIFLIIATKLLKRITQIDLASSLTYDDVKIMIQYYIADWGKNDKTLDIWKNLNKNFIGLGIMLKTHPFVLRSLIDDTIHIHKRSGVLFSIATCLHTKYPFPTELLQIGSTRSDRESSIRFFPEDLFKALHAMKGYVETKIYEYWQNSSSTWWTSWFSPHDFSTMAKTSFIKLSYLSTQSDERPLMEVIKPFPGMIQSEFKNVDFTTPRFSNLEVTAGYVHSAIGFVFSKLSKQSHSLCFYEDFVAQFYNLSPEDIDIYRLRRMIDFFEIKKDIFHDLDSSWRGDQGRRDKIVKDMHYFVEIIGGLSFDLFNSEAVSTLINDCDSELYHAFCYVANYSARNVMLGGKGLSFLRCMPIVIKGYVEKSMGDIMGFVEHQQRIMIEAVPQSEQAAILAEILLKRESLYKKVFGKELVNLNDGGATRLALRPKTTSEYSNTIVKMVLSMTGTNIVSNILKYSGQEAVSSKLLMLSCDIRSWVINDPVYVDIFGKKTLSNKKLIYQPIRTMYPALPDRATSTNEIKLFRPTRHDLDSDASLSISSGYTYPTVERFSIPLIYPQVYAHMWPGVKNIKSNTQVTLEKVRQEISQWDKSNEMNLVPSNLPDDLWDSLFQLLTVHSLKDVSKKLDISEVDIKQQQVSRGFFPVVQASISIKAWVSYFENPAEAMYRLFIDSSIQKYLCLEERSVKDVKHALKKEIKKYFSRQISSIHSPSDEYNSSVLTHNMLYDHYRDYKWLRVLKLEKIRLQDQAENSFAYSKDDTLSIIPMMISITSLLPLETLSISIRRLAVERRKAKRKILPSVFLCNPELITAVYCFLISLSVREKSSPSVRLDIVAFAQWLFNDRECHAIKSSLNAIVGRPIPLKRLSISTEDPCPKSILTPPVVHQAVFHAGTFKNNTHCDRNTGFIAFTRTLTSRDMDLDRVITRLYRSSVASITDAWEMRQVYADQNLEGRMQEDRRRFQFDSQQEHSSESMISKGSIGVFSDARGMRCLLTSAATLFFSAMNLIELDVNDVHASRCDVDSDWHLRSGAW